MQPQRRTLAHEFTMTPVSCSTVKNTIQSVSTITCSLDPLLTFVIKNYVDLLSPMIIYIVNQSLITGEFPSLLKLSHVRPRLKNITSTRRFLRTTDLDSSKFKETTLYMFLQIFCHLQFELQSTELKIYSVRKMLIKYKNKGKTTGFPIVEFDLFLTFEIKCPYLHLTVSSLSIITLLSNLHMLWFDK